MAKRILIADDSVTIQKAFAMTLAGEDLSLVSARSAEEGLSLAQRGGARPDLVIADSVMTGGTGYDLCLAIKSDPSLRGVPVYLLTSLHNPFDDARARQVGADGQFLKPFESSSLVAGITDALAKGNGMTVAGPPLQAAPVRAFSTPVAPPPSVSVLDDYGEISVSGPSPLANHLEGVAPAPVRSAPMPASAPAPATAMRPSLIPGLRPGVAPARPGAAPVRSPGMPGPAPGPAPVSPFPPAVRGPAPQPPAAPMRTMMLPAGGLQPPPRTAVPGGTLPPAARPVAVPASGPPVTGLGAQVAASVASRVAERMAAVSARGPEYEAVAKLSKEIIEKIAWEIVPELAEAIIREELQKRGRI